jgi:hypothetical protein
MSVDPTKIKFTLKNVFNKPDRNLHKFNGNSLLFQLFGLSDYWIIRVTELVPAVSMKFSHRKK